ncbi:class I SAM-dependent methyltransferase [Flagellimonas onchidii]|uniref:class I SAM-dependent methyltransferase n=1 Tax=Flagellimonas onchidii TaxID=2562684 RepID=UPI0010A65FCD|nr:class I SAM-dependent methyltransferase [Allomuricauda onchidii]
MTKIKDTGAVTSLVRSLEQKHNTPLFKDSFAELFVDKGAENMFKEKMDLYPHFQQLIAVRHKIIRDEINFFIKSDSSFSQLLSIGSGYCTIVNEIQKKHKNLKGYEIDMPAVLKKKISKIKVEYLPKLIYCDVVEKKDQLVPKLLSNGFNIEKRSLIFLEGLLYYMPNGNFINLFIKTISEIMSSDSILIFDMQVGKDSYSNKETDFLNYFEDLSAWSSMIEDLNLSILKYGNIAFLDQWNRLNAFRGEIKSSLFVITKHT